MRRGEHRDQSADTQRLEPILTDAPVTVHNPRGKIRAVMVLFAAAIVLAAASAYLTTVIAYQRSTRHTDQRIATLERDLAQRRAVRADRDRETQALLEQYRHTICVLAEQHSGPTIDQLRADYRCGPSIPSTPPSTPGASPTRASRGTAPRAPAPRPSPAAPGTPRPQPAPSPPPDGTPDEPFCLPLLGCLP